jgi:hypothetical protein
MEPSKRMRRVKSFGAGAALAAGLVAGGVAVASAATSSGTPSQSASGSSSTNPNPPPGPRGGGGGTVSAFTSSSLTVTDPSGTSHSFVLTSATTYMKDGATARYSDLAVGEHVGVRSDQTSSSTSTPTAAEVDIMSPDLAGTIESVTGSSGDQTIVVADGEGFWRTIQTSAATTYMDNGSTVTSPTLSVGEFIAAFGTIDANHTTLDASKVSIGKPSNPGPGMGGPGGPGGFGGGPGGPPPGSASGSSTSTTA